MKVIIVEDEPRVRRGLSEAVDWGQLDMKLVGTATNGLEGLELFREEQPDLVIADIRMPVMDGLAMTEAILEEKPFTKVVIISGHDEFEYAQRCIRLGVENYLLKPIGRKELRAEIDKIRVKWKKSMMQRKQTMQLEEELKLHLPQIRGAFVEEWLNDTSCRGVDTLREQLVFMQIPLDPNRPTATAIFEADLDVREAGIQRDRRLLEYSLYSLLEQWIEGKGFVFMRGNGQTVVLFQGEGSYGFSDEPLLWVNQMMGLAKEQLSSSITVAIGSRSVSLDELPAIFQETKRILGLKMSLGTGIILDESMLNPLQEQLAVLPEAEEALLAYGVEMNDTVEIARIIGNHFTRWNGKRDIAFADEVFFQFIGLYSKLVHRLGRSVRDCLNGKDLSLWQQTDLFHSLDEMREWWTQRFVELSEWYQGFRTDKKTRLIKQVIQYVDDHIYDHITRDEAAKHVFINSSYLSRLFREVTGESFSNYVLNKKIEKAIHLLQVERVMVYEVADRLGYKDPSYFARVLKKYTGKSPSDFQ